MLVKVRARKGRAAMTAPVGGQLIPQDKFILVRWSSWLDHLLNDYDDIELESKPSKLKAKNEGNKPEIAQVSATEKEVS